MPEPAPTNDNGADRLKDSRLHMMAMIAKVWPQRSVENPDFYNGATRTLEDREQIIALLHPDLSQPLHQTGNVDLDLSYQPGVQNIWHTQETVYATPHPNVFYAETVTFPDNGSSAAETTITVVIAGENAQQELPWNNPNQQLISSEGFDTLEKYAYF